MAPPEQVALEKIAAALNKILDPDLTQGRVILDRNPGSTPTLRVTLSPPDESASYVEGTVGIKGMGLFQQVYASADWHPQVQPQIHAGESWALSDVGASISYQAVAESLVRLMTSAALRAVKYHQRAARDFASITNPMREKIR